MSGGVASSTSAASASSVGITVWPSLPSRRIETDQGHSLFLATRQILEDLGKDLLDRAAKMPLKKDQA